MRSHVDAYGCHVDTAEGKGKWIITCPICLGEGCEACKESGIYRSVKCQKRALTEAFDSLSGFFRAFRWMEEKAILPISGALGDQCCQFIKACEFMKQYAEAHRRKEERL